MPQRVAGLTVVTVALIGFSMTVLVLAIKDCGENGALTRKQYQAFYQPSVRDRSIASGNEIVSAITRYREAHGRLPRALQELVPGTLPTLPLPLDGLANWRYGVSPDGNGFNLAFGVGPDNFPRCYLHDGQWVVDD